MRWMDISMTLKDGMPVYPGDPQFSSMALLEIGTDGCATMLLSLGSHTGTHIDAPRHFFAGPGAIGADEVPLELLCGPARVVEFFGQGNEIQPEFLRGLQLGGVERLLLHTARSENGTHGAWLSQGAARYIRDETGIRLLGIDRLSVEEQSSSGNYVHRILLEPPRYVVLLEGLVLEDVGPGDYELFCMPLKVRDSDGSPARAALLLK